MKKSILFVLPALALAALTSCEPDTDPKLDTTKDYDFVLNTPPLANQFIDLKTEGIIEFTLSQPNYGITLAPNYELEMSLSPEFQPLSAEPVIDSEGEEHILAGSYPLTLEGSNKGVLSVSMANIALGILELNGIFDDDMYEGDYEGPVYFRSICSVGDGYSSELTSVTSNVVTLSQVRGYKAEASNADLTLCVPGNGNGWSNTPDQPALVSNDGGLTYVGFAYIDNGFKITDGDWSDPNWGAGDAGEGSVEGLLYDPESNTYSGPLIFNGGNLNDTGAALQPGMYYIKVEVITMEFTEGGQGATITLTPIESINVIGNFNDWSLDTAVQMTVTGSNNAVFTATGNFPNDGWKFEFNGSWDINLGGDMNKLTFDGDNIYQEATTITLNLSQYPWTCTVE